VLRTPYLHSKRVPQSANPWDGRSISLSRPYRIFRLFLLERCRAFFLSVRVIECSTSHLRACTPSNIAPSTTPSLLCALRYRPKPPASGSLWPRYLRTYPPAPALAASPRIPLDDSTLSSRQFSNVVDSAASSNASTRGGWHIRRYALLPSRSSSLPGPAQLSSRRHDPNTPSWMNNRPGHERHYASSIPHFGG
jgi:hypothetical protein